MISHSNRFIFVHVPKTGGTSIERTIQKYGTCLQGKRNFDSIYYKHITANSLKILLGDEFDTYFKFTVVRNPWDWIVSNYEYNRGVHRPYSISDSDSDKQKDFSSLNLENMSFDVWLDWWVETFHPSQIQLLVDCDGKLLTDKVIKFESLQEDFNMVCKKINIKPSKLPHKIKSNRRPYEEYYNSESKALVQRAFSADIEAFDYHF